MMNVPSLEAIEDLRGPAGRLEALVNRGRPDATFAAIVCHPHPPSGGTMHTKAVYHAAKALNSFGAPVLRFNFRGVGTSEGAYTNGPGEVDDVRAAMEWTHARYGLPLIVAGFSFGANMSLRASCGDPRVLAHIGLGTPIKAEGRSYTYEFLQNCTAPKLFVTGSQDPFAPRAIMESVLSIGLAPLQFDWIDGADHFFQGTPDSPKPKLDLMRTAIVTWVEDTFHLPAHP